jgi:hypothetical protein
MRRGTRAVAAALLLAACSGPRPGAAGTEDADTSHADAANDDGALPDAGTTSTCDRESPITIWVDTVDGRPSRVHVPAAVDGKSGVLLFDTGSNATFVSTPQGTHDPTPDGGTLQIGGCGGAVMGRPYASEDARGLPGLGFFGTDQILAAPRASLDLLGGAFARHMDGGPSTDGWLATPFEIVDGAFLVRIQLDGVAVRLVVDTGSQDILWDHQQGKPGDTPTQTTDALGNVVTLYHGTVSAEISPGVVETLPVDRTPSFPYFEQGLGRYGGDVQGLLGISALGARVVVIDVANRVLLRQP